MSEKDYLHHTSHIYPKKNIFDINIFYIIEIISVLTFSATTTIIVFVVVVVVVV
jgi:hypothetical protein